MTLWQLNEAQLKWLSRSSVKRSRLSIWEPWLLANSTLSVATAVNGHGPVWTIPGRPHPVSSIATPCCSTGVMTGYGHSSADSPDAVLHSDIHRVSRESSKQVDFVTVEDARFAEIYESFFRRVYGYCIRRTEPDRVDDVVADVFLIVWRRIEDVPAGDEALPWLYAVAYKVLGNQWRRQKRSRSLDERLRSLGIEPMSSVEDFIVAGEETRQVLAALSSLKRIDQETLRLAMWEELPHAEISVVLGISPGAVRQRLYEARKNLTSEYNRLTNKKSNRPAARKGGGQ